MSQNRKKLIDFFIGNISNAIVHEILDKAIDDEEISDKYKKEIAISLNKSKNYRGKINPTWTILPEKDIEYIKTRLITKVRNKLKRRILDNYENIDLSLIDDLVDKTLGDLNIK